MSTTKEQLRGTVRPEAKRDQGGPDTQGEPEVFEADVAGTTDVTENLVRGIAGGVPTSFEDLIEMHPHLEREGDLLVMPLQHPLMPLPMLSGKKPDDRYENVRKLRICTKLYGSHLRRCLTVMEASQNQVWLSWLAALADTEDELLDRMSGPDLLVGRDIIMAVMAGKLHSSAGAETASAT